MPDNIIVRLLITVLCGIAVHVVVRFFVGTAVERVVRQHHYMTKADEYKREQTLKGVLGTLIAVIIWATMTLVILQQLGVNLATLATGAGLFGVIFGFGAQSAIKDFVAGLCIIGENQYRVGDIIKLQTSGGPISGTVEDLTIRITRLRDLDGNVHVIGNGVPYAVTNLSFEYANVNIDIGVGYDTSIDKLEKIINTIGLDMAKDDTWKEDIIEPIAFLRIDEFEDSAMRIKSLGKVRPAAQWAIAGEFRRRIKAAFEKEGIDIPYPHVVVQQKPGVSTRQVAAPAKRKR